MGETDLKKFQQRVKRSIKKIRDPVDPTIETPYIDVDSLIGMYLDEYRTRKKTNQGNLIKEFVRVYQEVRGDISTTDFDEVFIDVLPSMSSSWFVKFVSTLSIRRAFIYALTCGENNS